MTIPKITSIQMARLMELRATGETWDYCEAVFGHDVRTLRRWMTLAEVKGFAAWGESK